jgi:glycyl-tRNA synthetase beta subunit
VTRHKALLRARGFKHDVVDGVLSEQGHDPAGAERAVEALQGWTEREDWPEILQAYARCARITRDQPGRYSVDPEGLEEAAERALFEKLRRVEEEGWEQGSLGGFLSALATMVPEITRFFDDVLVMTESKALRENRLGLLQRIVRLAEGVVDLSALEGF